MTEGKLTEDGNDHRQTTRATCAVALGQSPNEFLAKVKSTQRNTPISRVYHLFTALAAHRTTPTDRTRAALEAELARGDELLTNVSTGTDPENMGYAVTHRVELNWWMTRVRAELKAT